MSDIDIVVTNPAKLAKMLLEFLDTTSETFKTWRDTRAAVLLVATAG